jgi:hypothetical protein
MLEMRSTAQFAALILIAGAVHTASAEPPSTPAEKREQVFADPGDQLTGVAMSAKGRVFTNYPIWSPEHRYCVVEVVAGQARPQVPMTPSFNGGVDKRTLPYGLYRLKVE